jgi:hypothetical protein
MADRWDEGTFLQAIHLVQSCIIVLEQINNKEGKYIKGMKPNYMSFLGRKKLNLQLRDGIIILLADY